MLDRTTMTAQDLGIQQWELDGLLAFCRAADSGTLRHAKDGMWKNDLAFNYGFTALLTDCGTVCCVGAFVFFHRHGQDDSMRAHQYVHEAGKLVPIYFPSLGNPPKVKLNDISPVTAARYVRHFLATGEYDTDLLCDG